MPTSVKTLKMILDHLYLDQHMQSFIGSIYLIDEGLNIYIFFLELELL